VRRVALDFLVPALIGAVILVVVDVVRGEAAPWWAVAIIFVLAFAAWDGIRILMRRRSGS
jgi:hypothetical protein